MALDILKNLDQLQAAAVDEPRRFLGLTFGYDLDEIQMLISMVRASLPDELKSAAATIREKERILETAKEDATNLSTKAQEECSRILNDARQKADRMVEEAQSTQSQLVSESEVLKLAKAQADEIRSAADRYALQTRREADQYASALLTKLETNLTRLLQVVDRDKAEIVKDLSLEPVAVVAARPRQRV